MIFMCDTELDIKRGFIKLLFSFIMEEKKN